MEKYCKNASEQVKNIFKKIAIKQKTKQLLNKCGKRLLISSLSFSQHQSD